jgi:hypothetical protein
MVDAEAPWMGEWRLNRNGSNQIYKLEVQIEQLVWLAYADKHNDGRSNADCTWDSIWCVRRYKQQKTITVITLSEFKEETLMTYKLTLETIDVLPSASKRYKSDKHLRGRWTKGIWNFQDEIEPAKN